MNDHYENLKAFLEGLECNDIDELLATGTPDRFRQLGSTMAAISKIHSAAFLKQQQLEDPADEC